MLRVRLIVAIFGLAIFSSASLGAGYDYPYKDPYYATLTTAILKADHLDKSLIYEDFSLRTFSERDTVPYFGPHRNKITLRLWSNTRDKAPLLVMVAGLGGGSNSNYYNFLGSHFAKKGFHVLVFPSPFHWTFALSASTSTYPGVTREDAQDLYNAIDSGIDKVVSRAGIAVSSIGLLGFSMGALEAAYLSEIDSREGRVGFQKTLLLNPPVNPLASGMELDRLRAKGDEFPNERKKDLQQRVYLFGLGALTGMDIKDPAYFLGLESRLPTSERERKFLIGDSLRDFLSAMIFSSQQVDDLGVVKTPIDGKNPDARMEECAQFSYLGYIENFLLPGLAKQRGTRVTLDGLMPDVLMSGVESHLRLNENIFLMHNSDDFIVKPNQIAYMQNVFGSRMKLYPYGGHGGNFWYPENLEAILGTFDSLKE